MQPSPARQKKGKPTDTEMEKLARNLLNRSAVAEYRALARRHRKNQQAFGK
jgi:hypothetical protein